MIFDFFFIENKFPNLFWAVYSKKVHILVSNALTWTQFDFITYLTKHNPNNNNNNNSFIKRRVSRQAYSKALKLDVWTVTDRDDPILFTKESVTFLTCLGIALPMHGTTISTWLPNHWFLLPLGNCHNHFSSFTRLPTRCTQCICT